MPGNEKGSFWATTSGMTTGIAGTLTGVLGIVAVASQAGWIGGDKGEEEASSASSESAATTSSTAGDGSSTTLDGRASGEDGTSAGDDDLTTTTDEQTERSASTPVFSVSPSSMRFTALGTRTTTAEVRNTGDVDLNVQNVTVEGPDAGRFSVDPTPCTSNTVEADRSCDVEVTFNPSQSGGAVEATMVIDVADARSREVPLAGEPLL